MATITKRENGKWQAKCRRKGFRSQSKTFRTKDDAMRRAREVVLAMDRSVFQSTSDAEMKSLKQSIAKLKRFALDLEKSIFNRCRASLLDLNRKLRSIKHSPSCRR